MKILPSRIVEARKRARLTQRDLAEALNVTVQAVSQWENGKTDPSSRLEALANALKVSKNDLTDLLNNINPDPIKDEFISSAVDIISINDLGNFYSSDPATRHIFSKKSTTSTTKPHGLQFGVTLTFDSGPFKSGDILIFDEGLAPKPGDYGAMIVLGHRGRIILSAHDQMQFRGAQGMIVRFSEGPLEVVEPDPKTLSSAILKHAEDGPMVCVGTLVERRTFRPPDITE